MSEICQVCGRTPKELKNKFGLEPPILIEVEGITKCSKCDSEYKAGKDGKDSKEKVVPSDSHYLDKITA